ncbi:UNKNOWN [Stylonychia lemnae]|uniref:rRNA-processing protein EFG1 n=1 Tax=Stylonychia lemnae TaxID=5949 RepID=A0A078A316_STYLE|nr:UNKNOWN [Stylonychia lemnae]|eukprot:CDW76673.1 UNKNOWN [Stylonychia lemnae]
MVKQGKELTKPDHKDQKHEKKSKRKNSDQSAGSDKDDTEMVDINAPKVLPNPKNTLKMGKFHRYTNQYKGKKRAPTNKKRIRDLERLLAKEGIPEEMKVAKKKELRELQKLDKKKEEAEIFELKYKKIKFFEKKKVIKKLETLKKELAEIKDSEQKQKLEAEFKEQRKMLIYIDTYPPHKKYIALFPKEDSEEGKQQRQKMMEKILRIAEQKDKVREKELLHMDEESDDDQEKIIAKKTKQLEKTDNFFTLEADEVQEEQPRQKQSSKPQKKLLVQRNGKVVDPDTLQLVPEFNDPPVPLKKPFANRNSDQKDFANKKPQYNSNSSGREFNRREANEQSGFKRQAEEQQNKAQASRYDNQQAVQQPAQQIKIKANAYRIKGIDMEQKSTHIKF